MRPVGRWWSTVIRANENLERQRRGSDGRRCRERGVRLRLSKMDPMKAPLMGTPSERSTNCQRLRGTGRAQPRTHVGS